MWRHHGLPEEDGFFQLPGASTTSAEHLKTVAIVAYPRISNLDEFQPIQNVSQARLVWARTPSQLSHADWIILPGSKHTSGDLAWLRSQGLDRAIAAHAGAGGAVLGICGGLQMLGEVLADPHGIDGEGTGLGLLPLRTTFEAEKTVRRTTASFATLRGPWAALSGVELTGYEIHHGRTAPRPGSRGARLAVTDALGWQNARGNVLGLYLHGMFEDPRVMAALFGAVAPTLDSVFDGLADFITRHFRRGTLAALVR
jgi:adenosylcobyric acid synthase